ncbi:hypothetical protein [Caloranaerobacter ferrireducens]
MILTNGLFQKNFKKRIRMIN